MPTLEGMLGGMTGTSMNVDNTGNLRVIMDASAFCSSSTLLTASMVPGVSMESIAFATSFSEIQVVCIVLSALVGSGFDTRGLLSVSASLPCSSSERLIVSTVSSVSK